MARITYTDLERAAPYTEFHGIAFTTGQPVEVPDSLTEVIDLLSRNRWFKVERNGQATAEQPRQEAAPVDAFEESIDLETVDKVKRLGRDAHAQGRDRRCPPRWTQYEWAWLEGFDDAAGHPISG